MSAPRDLVAEARAMAKEIKPDSWPDTRPLQQRAAAANLLVELADEIKAVYGELEKVREHIDERPEYITACLNAGPDSDHDYYRWQGGAEGRRQLAQKLDWTVPHKPGEKTSPKGGES